MNSLRARESQQDEIPVYICRVLKVGMAAKELVSANEKSISVPFLENCLADWAIQARGRHHQVDCRLNIHQMYAGGAEGTTTECSTYPCRKGLGNRDSKPLPCKCFLWTLFCRERLLVVAVCVNVRRAVFILLGGAALS